MLSKFSTIYFLTTLFLLPPQSASSCALMVGVWTSARWSVISSTTVATTVMRRTAPCPRSTLRLPSSTVSGCFWPECLLFTVLSPPLPSCTCTDFWLSPVSHTKSSSSPTNHSMPSLSSNRTFSTLLPILRFCGPQTRASSLSPHSRLQSCGDRAFSAAAPTLPTHHHVSATYSLKPLVFDFWLLILCKETLGSLNKTQNILLILEEIACCNCTDTYRHKDKKSISSQMEAEKIWKYYVWNTLTKILCYIHRILWYKCYRWITYCWVICSLYKKWFGRLVYLFMYLFSPSFLFCPLFGVKVVQPCNTIALLWVLWPPSALCVGVKLHI